MNNALPYFLLTLSLTMSQLAHAADPYENKRATTSQLPSAPVITGAWARSTVPGQVVGSAYMTISSREQVTLVHAETEVAEEVQVHTMHVENGIMKMREHGALDIPAGTTVSLARGKLHFMLLGLKRHLKHGETIIVKVTFRNAENMKNTSVVRALVRPVGYAGARS